MVDTNVLSSRLVHGKLAERYQPVLTGPLVASFITDAEIRFGARNRSWGVSRLRQLDHYLADIRIVWPGPELTRAYVELRERCTRTGHALGSGKHHEADRWIAAAALWLDVPLVTDDRIFRHVDRLDVLSAPAG